ncbi:hypothetical protein [Streptococcus saliviloxodontae]|uniref:Cystathionine gamma-synthase n=1 Tax=Streptococcus saliviloxodontae TaxID=1349416 RepID=A0ABS2PJK3_9STRE|nr:hypothetical protein [Streptococcus saliviloxodontae]MBM7635603.1 hypothetical protein [Streptococcus saliviloxodontae]
MNQVTRPFPLVKDDEPIIGQSRLMKLYENEDLINNIRGNYQDKNYNEVEETQVISSNLSNQVTYKPSQTEETYARQARETAREDIKRKRHLYLKNEVTQASQKRKSSSPILTRQVSTVEANQAISPSPNRQEVESVKPKRVSQTGLSRFSDKLRQEEYILVELPKTYQKPQNPSTKKVKKNNYDFLKRSQVYNQKERQENKERRVAQELNLTRFEADE